MNKHFIILLLIILICLFLRIISIFIEIVIDCILDKNIIKKYSENIQKVIIFINNDNEIDYFKDIFEKIYDKILIININNICKESIVSEIYKRKKLYNTALPCLVLIDKRKIEVIKLYNILHISKNKFKKKRKLEKNIEDFIESNY